MKLLIQAFRQEAVDGHYLRVNPIFGRWEIAEELTATDNSDKTLFVSASCYTLCPANLLETTGFLGQQLSWVSHKWAGLTLSLRCTRHSNDDNSEDSN